MCRRSTVDSVRTTANSFLSRISRCRTNKLLIKISFPNHEPETIDTNTYLKLSEADFRHHPEIRSRDKFFNLYGEIASLVDSSFLASSNPWKYSKYFYALTFFCCNQKLKRNYSKHRSSPVLGNENRNFSNRSSNFILRVLQSVNIGCNKLLKNLVSLRLILR